jgi:hypothetical protein
MALGSERCVEQRVFSRLRAARAVRYRVVRGGADIGRGDGFVVNLSAGGMLLSAGPFEPAVVGELFSRAAHVVVELPVADGAPIAAVASLVWVEDPQDGERRQRYGLEFQGMGTADQQRVEDWIVGAG